MQQQENDEKKVDVKDAAHRVHKILESSQLCASLHSTGFAVVDGVLDAATGHHRGGSWSFVDALCGEIGALQRNHKLQPNPLYTSSDGAAYSMWELDVGTCRAPPSDIGDTVTHARSGEGRGTAVRGGECEGDGVPSPLRLLPAVLLAPLCDVLNAHFAATGAIPGVCGESAEDRGGGGGSVLDDPRVTPPEVRVRLTCADPAAAPMRYHTPAHKNDPDATCGTDVDETTMTSLPLHYDALPPSRTTRPRRLLSCVYYPCACVDGELLLYPFPLAPVRVAPQRDRLVVFGSKNLLHGTVRPRTSRAAVLVWLNGAVSTALPVSAAADVRLRSFASRELLDALACPTHRRALTTLFYSSNIEQSIAHAFATTTADRSSSGNGAAGAAAGAGACASLLARHHADVEATRTLLGPALVRELAAHAQCGLLPLPAA
eukprot:gnl/Spiro4/29580_TR14494_c0_g1_i1.p1 gnl/Spiro4/29580_TR14494_c0_g1~~gnl/Spiro4/29580_TR14494_c0_g1_i1.p1  ORF type:complete len:432 (+),score=116.51 gnl/Spiro4/29580_TR14494_c0_g1_i1:52-1347(+)